MCRQSWVWGRSHFCEETDRWSVSEILAVEREAELAMRGMEIIGAYPPCGTCEKQRIKSYLYLICLLMPISANKCIEILCHIKSGQTRKKYFKKYTYSTFSCRMSISECKRFHFQNINRIVKLDEVTPVLIWFACSHSFGTLSCPAIGWIQREAIL